jgi:hypothetical protein
VLPNVSRSYAQRFDAADSVGTRIHVVAVLAHHALVTRRNPHPTSGAPSSSIHDSGVTTPFCTYSLLMAKMAAGQAIHILEERDAVVIEFLEAAVQLLGVHVALQGLAESHVRIPLRVAGQEAVRSFAARHLDSEMICWRCDSARPAPPAAMTLPRRMAKVLRDRLWNVTDEELSVASCRPMYSLLAELARTTTSLAVRVMVPTA